MATTKRKGIDSKYGDPVERAIATIVYDNEYKQAKSNNDVDYAEYENLLDLLDGIRAEKNYSWNSDIHIPLFFAHLASEASTWAAQYFSSRDFCDVYLEGLDPKDKLKSYATKVLINKTLNMKDIYHYHKYIRGRMINWLFGQKYTICYWDFKSKMVKVKQPPEQRQVPEIDEQTGDIVYRPIQIPQPDKEEERVILDRFNYDVIDPRNVYTDYGYTYSVQDKPWVIIRSDCTYAQLKADEERYGYFNLDKVESLLSPGRNDETDTGLETYNYNQLNTPIDQTPETKFDLLQRFGTMWCIVEEIDDDGVVAKAKPGWDDNGIKDEDAELIQTIISFVVINGKEVLIRFQPTPFIDSKGEPYYPLVRSWCYIHPARDTGLSDGKNLRELNIAIDDTFNISQDRVMLSTLPVLKGRKMSLEDNPTVYIEPEHIIELENPREDLMEMDIKDNIQGALQQITSLDLWAQKTDGIFPPNMGGLPDKTSVTATASAAGESHANARGGFKSLTYEYTDLIEFYWIILQMTYRFARPETAMKLMGQLAYVFDPDGDYTYVPLSKNLESEHTKRQKVATMDQMMGRVSALLKVFPKEAAMITAKILQMEFEELGAEYQDVKGILDALTKAKPAEEGKGAEGVKDGKPEMTSNEQGLPVSPHEAGARALGNAAAGNM